MIESGLGMHMRCRSMSSDQIDEIVRNKWWFVNYPIEWVMDSNFGLFIWIIAFTVYLHYYSIFILSDNKEITWILSWMNTNKIRLQSI